MLSLCGWHIELGNRKRWKGKQATIDKKSKAPTEKGIQVGITGEMRHGQYGSYMALFYNKEAQRFLLDNLKKIIEAQNC